MPCCPPTLPLHSIVFILDAEGQCGLQRRPAAAPFCRDGGGDGGSSCESDGEWGLGAEVPSDGGGRRLGGRRGRRAARVAHGALRSALILHVGPRGATFPPSPPRERSCGWRPEMLLAVRAITYLYDAMPCTADTVVRHRLLPVLCSRLLAIEYLDVAEQCLQAFEKISLRQPAQCLQAGMITVVLVYMDFVSASIQRVVVSAVANACKKVPADCSQFVMDSVPMLCNLLQSEEKMTRRSSVMDLHGSVIEGCLVSRAPGRGLLGKIPLPHATQGQLPEC
ncbi:uncharacterized protein LOC125546026 isoform X3 [Triticum urartu]|uniref:uncharacterized protein LOC125546026 isoform X3 n=1 Tax=Triticum urartu TaxID=4572 RepID=UPI00204382D4|nr:uncharacterized protein LOC125546026 isoform X3 [Triticum urartu]